MLAVTGRRASPRDRRLDRRADSAARVGLLAFPEERSPGMHRADRIRNVALVGHRGSGKTSLYEALLYEAGVINRLGSVTEGTTPSDGDPDEQARQMSISASLSSFEWQDRKINLLDTPGEPSFVADALGALRVCESAVFVVNAVMGVEVSTDAPVAARRRARPRAHGLREHARPRARRLLPHAGDAEVRLRPARRRHRDPDRHRARRPRRDRPRRHEGLRVRRRRRATAAARSRSPTSSSRRPRSTARSSWTRSPRSPTRSWSATSRARRSPTRRSSRR